MKQNNQALYSLLNKQTRNFLGFAILSGVLAIYLGFQFEASSPFMSNIIITIGGTALGTCFGLVFGGVSGASSVQRVYDLLKDSLNGFSAASEEDLNEFRMVWHHYLVTEMNGKRIWRYRVLNLVDRIAPGKLLGEINVLGSDDNNHKYFVEGYLLGSRLVLFQKPSVGAEPPIVHIFPYAKEAFRNIHAGMAILKTWSAIDAVVPILITKTPIPQLGKVAVGTLPETAFSILDEMWNGSKEKSGLNFFFEPSVEKQQGAK